MRDREINQSLDILLSIILWIIGASLSKPHTSVTALRKCVCMYLAMDRPLTVNFMSAFKYFTKIDIDIVKHVKASGGLLTPTV